MYLRVVVYKVVAFRTRDWREVVQMEANETADLLFLDGTFLFVLHAYIV